MKIYAFADEASPNIDEQLEALKQNGLQGLEIRNANGINVADITEERAREIKRKTDEADLEIWSVGSPIGKIELKNADIHAEKFKRLLKTAKILGARNIRLFSYYLPSENYERYAEEVILRLKELVKLAEGENLTLCHENEKGIFGDTPERCLLIHKEIPEIKAIFDPANYIQCGVDTLKAWEIIKPYVKYLHIKDALPDGRVVPAGKGAGSLKYILDDFKRMGGDCVTLEPHLTVFDGLSSLEREENRSCVGEIYSYPSATDAFKAASDALKELL